jgi:hypothetical protein
MGSIRKLARKVEEGLTQALPKLRKTISRKLSLAVAAMIEARTANTAMIANTLPLETEQPDNRQQWMRRLLMNTLLDCATIMEPFARALLREAADQGRTVLLSMDQTEIGARFAVLVVSVRVGDRSLPLAWYAEAGEANIGFAGQQMLLERVLGWLPANTPVLLSADRFYPSARLILWLQAHRWQYRLRLKGNLSLDVGQPGISTTGELAAGNRERYAPKARLFESGIETHIGVLHEPDHPEPWIIAMDCKPTRAAVLDYGARWCIEPMFSDFKTRGFGLSDTQLTDPERLERLMLIMALAMYWCVRTGRDDATYHPTTAEKNALEQRDPDHWSLKQAYRSMLSWFTRGLRLLLRRAQNNALIPVFFSSVWAN